MVSEKIMEEMPEGLLSNEKLPLDLPEDFGATPSQIEASRPSQVLQPSTSALAVQWSCNAFLMTLCQGVLRTVMLAQGTPGIMPPMPSPGPAPRHLPGAQPLPAFVTTRVPAMPVHSIALASRAMLGASA